MARQQAARFYLVGTQGTYGLLGSIYSPLERFIAHASTGNELLHERRVPLAHISPAGAWVCYLKQCRQGLMLTFKVHETLFQSATKLLLARKVRSSRAIPTFDSIVRSDPTVQRRHRKSSSSSCAATGGQVALSSPPATGRRPRAFKLVS
jgi:hypothetical protein